jgi:flagellar FliL protein
MPAKARAVDSAEDAEDKDAAAEANAAKQAKSPWRRRTIIAAAALALVLAAGVGAYAVLKDNVTGAAVPPKAAFMELPEVLVNLSVPAGERTQYLKLKIVLEVGDPRLIQQIQPLMPRIMDAFQTYLRELRPSDLNGSAGLYRLREELTRRINASIEPAQINAVLFKEMIVQ